MTEANVVPPPAPAGRARITPLPPQFPNDWAVAYGEDAHGLWQAFEVAGVRQVMRWIPPGSFTMGSPATEPGRFDGETAHPVRLTAGLWLADTACSQALWAAVMGGDNPSGFKDDPLSPVEQVSWADVVDEFLPRLNAQVPGLAAVLPSEAWWEYACRGDAERNTPFWFGEQIDSEQVNFDGSEPLAGGKKSAYRETTVTVKALPCNGWGLYQMHGNVWEWCADWFAPYPLVEAEDPAGPPEAPTESARRVLRGGAWIRKARYCRSALRGASVPGLRLHDIGFRLARAAS
jgi:formylglycine-generating enzyme required for sulfatase activity